MEQGTADCVPCFDFVSRAIASKLRKQGKQKGIIQSGLLAFLAQAAFGFIGFQDIESEMAQESHVLGTVPDPNTGVIFMKNDIQDPVETIFDSPMGACRRQNAGSVIGQRTNIVGRLALHLSADMPFALNANQAV